MPSVWIERYETGVGVRWRVRYRLGGGGRKRDAGVFKTRRDADIRRMWVGGEIAARRVPDFSSLEPDPVVRAPVFEQAAAQWVGSRIDVGDATLLQNRTSINRACQVIGDRPVDELTAQEIAAMVVRLHEEGSRSASYERSSKPSP